MDNNNFGQQNMGQPMQQPGMPIQPMVQPGMQPMQPMQPTPPQKPPMDPAKKRGLILGLSIGGVVLALGIVAIILIPILTRIDYAPAYSAVKNLKDNVYKIYQSYDCEYVVNYVRSDYTTIKTYNEYIEGCQNVYSSETDELVAKLENTDAVKRNDEVKAQFAKFKAEYTAAAGADAEELAAKLALWQAWHNYHVTSSNFDYSSTTDAEFTTAANYLIQSGNDVLKTYGEGWLERSLEVAAAYRTYRNTSWSSSDYAANRENYNNKRNELVDWVAANKPDLNTVAPLNFNDTSKMYSEFTKLYDLIAETYAENYNSGSGDCTEFLGEVYCE